MYLLYFTALIRNGNNVTGWQSCPQVAVCLTENISVRLTSSGVRLSYLVRMQVVLSIIEGNLKEIVSFWLLLV